MVIPISMWSCYDVIQCIRAVFHPQVRQSSTFGRRCIHLQCTRDSYFYVLFGAEIGYRQRRVIGNRNRRLRSRHSIRRLMLCPLRIHAFSRLICRHTLRSSCVDRNCCTRSITARRSMWISIPTHRLFRRGLMKIEGAVRLPFICGCFDVE